MGIFKKDEEKQTLIAPQRQLTKLETQLHILCDMYADELKTIKGWNFTALKRVLTVLFSAIPTVVPAWNSATPDDRKDTFITVLNEYIDIPLIGETIEAFIFSLLYDLVISKIPIFKSSIV